MKRSIIFGSLMLFAACSSGSGGGTGGGAGGGGGSGGGSGTGWIQTATLPTGQGTGAISVLVDGDTVLVGTSKGLAKSTDDGASWKDSSVGLPDAGGGVSPVEALGVVSATLLAGTDNGTFSSTDHGATWTKASTGLPDTVSPYAFWTVGTTVLVGMNAGAAAPIPGGLFRSTDKGQSWTVVGGWPAASGGVSFAQLGTTVFTCFGMNVGRSTDSGQTWASSPSPGGSNALWLETQNGALFAATANAGVYKSSDGIAWTAAKTGLPMGEIVSTVFSHGGKLYAGTDTKGVFVSSDDGANWTAFSDGFSSPNPRVVQFAVHGTTLIAITEFGGVWKRAL